MYLSNVIYIFLQIIVPTLSFNLDTSSIVVLEGGQKNSQFGYSVAFWTDRSKRNWVVVSAPLFKNSFFEKKWKSFGSKGVNLNSTFPSIGAIFLCNMQKKCERLTNIPYPANHTEWDLKANFPSIGLGETLQASKSSKSLLICAPRNIHGMTETPKIILSLYGACYLYLDKHMNKPIYISPFDGRSLTKEEEESLRSSANAGMGAFLIDDKVVAIGSPTIFHNSGSVMKYTFKKDEKFFTQSRRFPKSNQFDTFYEGWAITGGKYDGRKKYIAVSVPGEPALLGKVVFYTEYMERIANFELAGEKIGGRYGNALSSGDFDGDGGDDLAVACYLCDVSVTGLNKQEHILVDTGSVYIYFSPLRHVGKPPKRQVLSGDKPRAWFGFSVFCPGDLNRDGFDDIIIGSPFDGRGKLFIFSGSNDVVKLKLTQIISSLDFVHAGGPLHKSLGWSVGGGVDIDGNGFPDVVVGDAIAGAAIVLRTQPVIKLKIEASMSPDGIIKLGGEKCLITLPDESQTLLTCFNMTLNVQYISETFFDRIVVGISLVLDARKSNSRLHFNTHQRNFHFERGISNSKSAPEYFNIRVYVRPSKHLLNDPIHTKIRVNLASKHRLAKYLPKIDDGTSVSQDASLVLPRLDVFDNFEVEASVRLICENFDVCFTKTDLSLKLEGRDTLEIGQDERAVVNITIIAHRDPAYRVRMKVIIPTELEYRRVITYSGNKIDTWCMIEDLNSNTEFETNRSAVIGKTTTEKPVHSPSHKQDKVYCYISDYIPFASKIQLALVFDYLAWPLINNLRKKERYTLSIIFEVLSDTSDRDPRDNFRKWSYNVVYKPEIFFISSSSPETLPLWHHPENGSALTNNSGVIKDERLLQDDGSQLPFSEFSQSSTEIVHKYTIINNGPSPLVDGVVSIYWPISFNEHILTSFTNHPNTFGRIYCNKIGFLSAQEEDSKNDTEETESNKVHFELMDQMRSKNNGQSSYKESHSSTTWTLDCDAAECLVIRCNVSTLLKNEEVKIEINAHAHDDNLRQIPYDQYLLSSKIEVYSAVGEGVRFHSSVSTSIVINKRQLTTIELVINKWWVIILAISLGVLLLLFISGALYKAGFFKRKRFETNQGQVLQQKTNAAESEIETSYRPNSTINVNTDVDTFGPTALSVNSSISGSTEDIKYSLEKSNPLFTAE